MRKLASDILRAEKLPKIRKKDPEFRFEIAGANWENAHSAPTAPGPAEGDEVPHSGGGLKRIVAHFGQPFH
jgi:hypothetical protein